MNSLAYEADARVKDPVYGCVGTISLLQQKVVQLQTELALARSELSRYTGAGLFSTGPSGSLTIQHGSPSLAGIGMNLSGPSSRAEQAFAAREPMMEPLTRQQMIEYARVAGSYESLAALGQLAGGFAPQNANYPPSRPGTSHDTSSSTSAGGQMGHFKAEPPS